MRPRLNPRSRFADGSLLCATALTDGGTDQIYNAARIGEPGSITTGSGTIFWASGPDGVGYKSGGTDFIVMGTSTIFSPAPNPYTALCRFVMAPLNSSSTNFGKMWGTWTNPQVSPYQNWGIFQNGGVIGVSMGNTNGPVDLLLDVLPIGSVHTVVQTWDGTTLRGYIDGIFVASTVISPTTGMATGPLAIGGNPGNAQEYWPAPVYCCALWSRFFSDAEVKQVSRDPYDLFDWGTASTPGLDQFALASAVIPTGWMDDGYTAVNVALMNAHRTFGNYQQPLVPIIVETMSPTSGGTVPVTSGNTYGTGGRAWRSRRGQDGGGRHGREIK